MSTLLHVVVFSALCLTAAYLIYGSLLQRLLRLDDSTPTPAVTERDDVDFVPIESKFLLSQHFSAIAAAGPIIGPILAGAMFGWLPALIWILAGSIFIGGVHDMTALVASIRHRARSIPEVVKEHMSQRAYVLFLAFVWLSLVYIIVAFTDVTASSFHDVLTLDRPDATETIDGVEPPDDGTHGQVVVKGAGIATSSLLYLALPIFMGLLLRYTKVSLNVATLLFLPLVVVAILVGPMIPFEIQDWFGLSNGQTRKAWNLALLAYCAIASVVPMWLLLQPRGHLGGYFMYAALLGGGIGVVIGGAEIKYPMFLGWTDAHGKSLFPVLFITIACGACSGFHSIIASGTTSKQLRRETDARVIGYGTMLLEAMVAVISLCCVMMLAKGDPLLSKSPNFLYAGGLGSFLKLLGVPTAAGVAFALMAFTTFVYDTLDVCTRLGRYILQELTGWKGAVGRWAATLATIAAPIPFLMSQEVDEKGRIVEVWRIFWELFGASNQLLAALTLLGVTIWLWRTYRAPWVWFVTGLPCCFMYAMSMWALCRLANGASVSAPIPYVAAVLLTLGALLLLEAFFALARNLLPPGGPRPIVVGA